MDWSSLAAFNLALLVAIASPGPSFLFLTRQTLARGRAVGLRTALGLGTMAALWTLMALLGLDRLFAVFPWVYGVMTLGGAIYLISIAVRTWRNAEVPVDDEAAQRGTQGAFLSGMLVNLANPKSVFFSAAVLLVIFPPVLTPVQSGVIFLNHLAVEAAVQSSLVYVLSGTAIKARYLSLKSRLDRLAALVLGALGLRLLLSSAER